jgi:hypothetical protein
VARPKNSNARKTPKRITMLQKRPEVGHDDDGHPGGYRTYVENPIIL